jgi:hypothetical protein
MKDLKPIPDTHAGAPGGLRVGGPIGLAPGRTSAPAAPVRPAPGWRLPSGQLLVEYALRSGFASSPLLVRLPLMGAEVEPDRLHEEDAVAASSRRPARSTNAKPVRRSSGRKRRKPVAEENGR